MCFKVNGSSIFYHMRMRARAHARTHTHTHYIYAFHRCSKKLY